MGQPAPDSQFHRQGNQNAGVEVAKMALQRAVTEQWGQLLQTPSPENLLAIVQHWHLWRPEQKKELKYLELDMTQSLKAAIVDGDLTIKNNAFDAITELNAFALVPDLIKLSMQPNYMHRHTSSVVLLHLIEQLYLANQNHQNPTPRPTTGPHGIPLASPTEDLDTLIVPRPVFKWPAAVPRLRPLMEASLQHYKLGGRVEVLMCHLAFSDQDDIWIERILGDKTHGAHEDILGLFETSEAEPVIHKLAGFLTMERPMTCLTAIWRRRADECFLKAFFGTIYREKTPEVIANLRRLSQPYWLNDVINDISPFTLPEQIALLDLIKNCLPQDEQILEAISRLLPQSDLPYRRKIVAAICQISGVKANQMVAELLDRETDAEILIVLIPELRRRNLARAMKKLLSLLDHHHQGVRKKASEAFHDCTIQRYLAAFDLLDEPVRRSTGQLVHKVDPSTNRVLAEELSCGVRLRQIRALQAIRSIGNIDELCSLVMKIAQNPDPRLKVAAIGTLAGSSIPESKSLIRRYLVDDNPSVRKAAELSLDVETNIFDTPEFN